MTGWRFDAARFVDEVLKPVQDGWRPDEDLFRVYLLPLDVSDTGTVRAALDEVGRRFTDQRYRGFRRATEVLRGRHESASGTLLDPARRAAHRARVEAGRRRLAAAVRARLGDGPALPPREVAAQSRALKVPRGAVLAALREGGGDEREPVELPPAVEPVQWGEARGHLAQLRRDSLWDYLAPFGGTATAERALAARREELRAARSADSAAETTLLRLVQGWLAAGDLVGVLRHEVLAHLADRAAYGYADAAGAAREVADRLRALDLGGDPAAVAYAVWCRHAFAGGAEPEWQRHYQHAVRDRRLRTALTVLQQQPSLPAEWAGRRDELERRLAGLDEELERCRALEATDVEAAAAGYLDLGEVLADDRVAAGLERCRPAPPPSARSVVRDGRVVVTWRPSGATAGRIAYRVTRGDEVLAEAVAAGELVDPSPPNATPLVYEVHALRDGNPSASAARTEPVVVLGEVLDLELRGDTDAVTGRWRLPAGALGAVVTRAGAPVAGAHPTGFTDRDARPGASHDYLVRARYRLPDGSTAFSAGVVAGAARQEAPVAVTDLVAGFDRDELVARWTPPPRGEVELLELRPGDDLPEPGVVPAHRARERGTPVRTTGPGGRGALRGRLSAPGGRHTVVPVTVLGDLAAIGAPVEVDARQGPVTGLRTCRFGPTVRLTWEWPEGATAARVVWRASAEPTGPTDPEASTLDVTRVGYDSRGVSIPVPEGDHWFGVCTARSVDGAPVFGPLVLRRETATTALRYSVRRAGPLSRRRTLRVEGGPRSPEVVLVAKSGVRPMDAADGRVLLRLAGGDRDAEFVVPRELPRPVHLRAFSLDDSVVLVPRRPDDLIVRKG